MKFLIGKYINVSYKMGMLKFYSKQDSKYSLGYGSVGKEFFGYIKEKAIK